MSNGVDTPPSVAESVGSEESESESHRRRYLSCPARLGGRPGSLKRRSARPIWEIAERLVSSEMVQDARSLSERVSDHELRHGSPALPSMHDSWPRVRKQRSDEDGRSMTLWQLSNAMAEAGASRVSTDSSTSPPPEAEGSSYEVWRPVDHHSQPQAAGDYKPLLHPPPVRHPGGHTGGHTSYDHGKQASDHGKQAYDHGKQQPSASPHRHGKTISGESPFDNAFVDAVLGIDKMHVAEAQARNRRPLSPSLPDGSEINMALMQLEALAAEARAEGQREELGADDFDPAELLAVLDSPGAKSVLALSPLRPHLLQHAGQSLGANTHRTFQSAPKSFESAPKSIENAPRPFESAQRTFANAPPREPRDEQPTHLVQNLPHAQAHAYPCHYDDSHNAPMHSGGGPPPSNHSVLRCSGGSCGSAHSSGHHRNSPPERTSGHNSSPHLAPCEPYAFAPLLHGRDSVGSSGSPAITRQGSPAMHLQGSSPAFFRQGSPAMHQQRRYVASSGSRLSGHSPAPDVYPHAVPVAVTHQVRATIPRVAAHAACGVALDSCGVPWHILGVLPPARVHCTAARLVDRFAPPTPPPPPSFADILRK
jgi:hypothetical protein